MTYAELAKTKEDTPVEVRMPGETPYRGILYDKTFNQGRAVRAEVRWITGGRMVSASFIPSVVHLVCPLQLLSEIGDTPSMID